MRAPGNKKKFKIVFVYPGRRLHNSVVFRALMVQGNNKNPFAFDLLFEGVSKINLQKPGRHVHTP